MCAMTLCGWHLGGGTFECARQDRQCTEASKQQAATKILVQARTITCRNGGVVGDEMQRDGVLATPFARRAAPWLRAATGLEIGGWRG
jgi:hypothetical protein